MSDEESEEKPRRPVRVRVNDEPPVVAVHVPAYVHRQLRVKPDRTLRIGARRYRPNELVDGEVPPEHRDAVTEA